MHISFHSPAPIYIYIYIYIYMVEICKYEKTQNHTVRFTNSFPDIYIYISREREIKRQTDRQSQREREGKWERKRKREINISCVCYKNENINADNIYTYVCVYVCVLVLTYRVLRLSSGDISSNTLYFKTDRLMDSKGLTFRCKWEGVDLYLNDQNIRFAGV